MDKRNLGLWVLTALVVGNMVGSGIFMLPRSLAEVASPGGVISAWVITGFGVLMTALVFGNLSLRKPELNGGPQNYAKALFKENTHSSLLGGYLVSWGYWVANWSGNVAIITTFASYLSTFFPVMESKNPLFKIAGTTITSGGVITFIVCSILLWGVHILILNGVEGAGKVNFAATAAKVLGFVLFIMACLFAFQSSNLLPFYQPVEGEGGVSTGFLGQVNSAAIATLWAFVGVESAVVFATRAKKKSDVKKATILGLLIALALYLSITLLVMGTLTQHDLVSSQKPLVDALKVAIGPSGGMIMALLGIISLTGATIGWVLLSAEVPFQAAQQKMFIPAFLKENPKGAPVISLWITNLCTQLFIFSVVSNSMAQAFDFMIFIATLAFLVPYIFAALYQLKLVITGDTYEKSDHKRMVDGIIAAIATIYSIWVIYAGTADIKTFLFGVALLASGIVFYPLVPKKGYHKEKNPVE
ncbi:amino acid permease [Fictibacillus barbaricus]|uniref:Arginine:ornithine antiporter/lysine permease n=1 Tax=Fictibacillus barbaricus TaxID=182136 RepID=A0ABU1TYM8_9BACL|nr:amino acid permease [Fictibacillus barbaricus]MDR7072312.1 arginine:ornithine antiporter/lysine permease [Fictibacillus barbaricus]